VEAIAVDPADVSRVFLGTVNGGVWESTNATNANPTWKNLTDQYSSLAISSIGISPLNSNVIFAGTGNLSSAGGAVMGSSGAGQGGTATGILRSTDGGTTWQIVGQSNLSGLRIRDVIPTAINDAGTGKEVVLAATLDGEGLFRSTDGGDTWSKVSGTLNSHLPSGTITSLVADPGNMSRFYAGIPGQGIYVSTDAGNTWKLLTTGLGEGFASSSV
jgi:photosystem II stability/assembly factor-like uncharacterized protein